MYENLKKVLDEASSIVFFGGAGVSTESDIPDFRSSTGMYNKKNRESYSPEQILSRSFFENNTEYFYKFYREKLIFQNAKPNRAHITLANLESRDKLRAIITQNIDGLHQAAGSKNVIELHGSIHKNYCLRCGKAFGLDYIVSSASIIPRCCACDGIIRPDIVLYEEKLDMDLINSAIKQISSADVLIVGGTSLVVYPAAGLLGYFKGERLVLINKSVTPYNGKADIVITNSIGSVLSEVILI